MEEIKILNAWGKEGNEFRNPATANNGGGYSQPYGGLTVQVGDEHLYIEVEDSGCGDFGERWGITIAAVERGMEWWCYIDQMSHSSHECEKELARWEADKRSIAGAMKITLNDVNALIRIAWEAVKICVDEEYWRKEREFAEWQRETEEAHQKWWADEENLKWWENRCAEWRKETHEMFGN